jgi:hypothetical protein
MMLSFLVYLLHLLSLGLLATTTWVRVRGTTIAMGGTAIGNVTGITPPNGMKREMTDVSGIADLYDIFAPGTVDPGSFMFTVNYGDPSLATVVTDYNSTTPVTWTITYPDGSTHVFSGKLSEASWAKGDRKGVFTVDLTIKISGAITFTGGTTGSGE